MVFSSLLFLFAFFSVHLIVYFFAPKKYKNIILLISSLIFYAWSGPKYLVLLVLDTAISWFCALKIERSDHPEFYLILECILLLGVLGIFKYTGFFLSNVQMLFGVPKAIPNIVLPIGISFYTFQLLSYVVDVYRKEVYAQPVFWKLLLYSSLFHQCIAGPIVRYETVQNDIDNRTVTFTDVYEGVRRFCIGLAKKAVLANSCATIADTLIPSTIEGIHAQSTLGLWLGMICFMLQIYLDFSAYSDMAIGMGRMIGFHYLENFNYPYIAHSVQDFWRRWHISLSSFFRDYVYIPLGGSRNGKHDYIRNMIVVWFLTGLWHGASWNYILWGIYYLIFLLLERFVIKDKIPKGWNHVYTLFVVLIGWTIFKFEDLHQLSAVLLGMFGIGANGFINLETTSTFMGNIYFLVFCIIACTPLSKRIRKVFAKFSHENSGIFCIFSIAEAILPILLLFLAFICLIGNSYNPFLYFQF